MKKTILTIAIILGLGLVGFGQNNFNKGGLFSRGDTPQQNRMAGVDTPLLPSTYGNHQDVDANVPLGGGLFVLTALGAAYAIGRKRREE